MIFVWKSLESYQQHVEEMKNFRRSHSDLPPAENAGLLRDVPFLMDSIPSGQGGAAHSFTDARGKLIVVPIWETRLPKGSQN